MKAEKKQRELEKQQILKQMEEDRQRRKEKFSHPVQPTQPEPTNAPSSTKSDAVVQCTLQVSTKALIELCKLHIPLFKETTNGSFP